ncbi:cytidine deaminase [Bacillota bacterium LX-D]|nr:cytidine deaminase [Bacillota bacterium LX-D]
MLGENEKRLLLRAASDVMLNAYAPYSGIKVGAALLAENGQVYTGVNVENSSFGLTVCAERNSVFTAVAQGEKNFVGLAIVTDSAKVTSPCGACRQVLHEFAPSLPIIFQNPLRVCEYTLEQLYPAAFRLERG